MTQDACLLPARSRLDRDRHRDGAGLKLACGARCCRRQAGSPFPSPCSRSCASASPAATPPETRASEALARVGLGGVRGAVLSGTLRVANSNARNWPACWCRCGRRSAPTARAGCFWTKPVASLDMDHQLEVMDLMADYCRARRRCRGGDARPEPDRDPTRGLGRDAGRCRRVVAQGGSPAEVLTDAHPQPRLWLARCA